MDSNAAISLLKQHGFFGLAGSDGCLCGSCEVHGIEMDIACRKSSGSDIEPGFYGTVIRVICRHLDADGAELRRVADVLVAEIQPMASHLPLVVRFASREEDREMKCVYCGGRRANPRDHLCAACKTKEHPFGGKVADQYGYEEMRFEPEPTP